jgi:hypothetical protein
MANAPTPGIGVQKEEAAAAKQIMTITIRGESHQLAIGNISFKDRLLLRKETGGLSFESFYAGETAVGLDSIMVLWWLARRADGEIQLTLERSNAEFPTDLGEDDFDVEIEDGKGDSPEV